MARDDRLHHDPVGPQPAQNQKVDASDQRRPFEIDRDRVLYCSAFRRLAGVTQVVTSTEGHLFHNRLTHSMKAAQVGRRLAKRVLTLSTQLPVDPEVVEAAALAHDLGHPPFGHMGEHVLNHLVTEAKVGPTDGYEGNAQTFRILTKLASRRPAYAGLNLSRAVLRSVIKYPWYKGKGPPEKQNKWNAYDSERVDFEFALGGPPTGDASKSEEAQLMEWADDIAYSVHDLEDFYRAGLIPLHELVVDSVRRDEFVSARRGRFEKLGVPLTDARFGLNIIDLAPSELGRRYEGSQSQRAALRLFTSRLIGRYVKGVEVLTNTWPHRLQMPRELEVEIAVLEGADGPLRLRPSSSCRSTVRPSEGDHRSLPSVLGRHPRTERRQRLDYPSLVP
ncbi:MAG: dNTP triphosphohydrolase [Polyangiaceae bacterium]|nr:dNTP triphosphohydrolase [Polyangiaceae bacterium]